MTEFTPVFADLVAERTRTVGGGALVLDGAAPGHRRFAGAVPAGSRFFYALAEPASEGWEVGRGTLLPDGTIAREPTGSSAGGAALPLRAGEKTVTLTVAAEWLAGRAAAGASAGVQVFPGPGAWGRQRAADGTAHDLPHLGARGEIECALPTHGAGAPATNAFGVKASETLAPPSAVAGGFLRYVQLGAPLTGHLSAEQVKGEVNGIFRRTLWNATTNGRAFAELRAGGGTALVAFNIPTKDWTCGVDAFDGRWKVSASKEDFTAPALSFERATRTAVFGGPARLQAVAKAALPAAATAGAGALLWVTDKADGAGPAMSDGTSWRVVALGAAVA